MLPAHHRTPQRLHASSAKLNVANSSNFVVLVIGHIAHWSHGLHPGANLCEIWQKIVQCPAPCCDVDLWLSWKIRDKAAAHGHGGQRGEAYLEQSGVGVSRGRGTPGTWRVAMFAGD